MAQPMKQFLVFCILIVFGYGVFDLVSNFERNGCEMTYMYTNPEYLEVPLDNELKQKFPKYSLHLYGEGQYARESESMRLRGIPVLFIPGNAGSHKQVRSLGSVAYKKSKDGKLPVHFNYFSLNLNEELSGLYGGHLQEQTEFAYACIKHILTLYKGAPTPPKTVVLIGHSMGGMIARGLFVLPNFDHSLVHTIVTQATPHQMPVISLDQYIADYYEKVNDYWRTHKNSTLNDVTVFSTSGGYRDILVRGGLARLDDLVSDEKAITTSTMSVPMAWVSTDHLCHVWCKQIVLTTKRAMFDMIGHNIRQIAINPVYRMGSFKHHFISNPGLKQYKGGSYDLMHQLDDTVEWEVRKKMSWSLSKDSVSKMRYSVIKLPRMDAGITYAFVGVTNVKSLSWTGPCSIKKSQPRCKQIGNLGTRSNMLPPLYSDKKALHLTHDWLAEFNHMVGIIPKSKKPVMMQSEVYVVEDRHLTYNVSGLLHFIIGFPRSVLAMDVVIPKTMRSAMFYNVTLRGLDSVLQALTAHVVTHHCTANTSSRNFAGTTLKFHVPWNNEDTFSFKSIGENLSHPLKLQTGRPDPDSDFEESMFVTQHPQLHLYLHPACTYSLHISIAWSDLFGQFARFYAPYLPSFFFIQILMALSWQLKLLDERVISSAIMYFIIITPDEVTVNGDEKFGFAPGFVDSQHSWAQPWRVIPVSLGLRLMLYYPEEDSMADRFGIPIDSRGILEQQNVYYPALPIMLYLVSYGAMSFYALFLSGIFNVLGRIFNMCCGSWTDSLHHLRAAKAVQYMALGLACLVGGFVCGTLGMIITYVVYVVKTISSSIAIRRHGDQVSSFFHVNLSMLILIMACVVLNGPSLIVWAKNISYSVVLDVDPSRLLGVVIPLSAILMLFGSYPIPHVELYSVCCLISYITCVLMSVYCTVEVHRVQYYVSTVLLCVGVSAALVPVFPWLQSIPEPIPQRRGHLPVGEPATAGNNEMESDSDEMPDLVDAADFKGKRDADTKGDKTDEGRKNVEPKEEVAAKKGKKKTAVRKRAVKAD